MRRIAIVAGELSGDALGAPLMAALKRRYPQVRFEGVGGPRMAAEGLFSLYPLETLSVMGLTEVLRHLPSLLRIRRDLTRRFLRDPPDCFIGVDAPDFNLGLERRLRERGIPAVHYVSPTVWAWREGRMKGIARSVSLMLTLFPFEVDVYRRHGVPVEWVGHPTADRLPVEVDHDAHRAALGIGDGGPICALLPGSRTSEVQRLGPVYADAVRRLAERFPELRFIAAMATDGLAQVFAERLEEAGVADRVVLSTSTSEHVLGAADVALVASGTATLEALLLKTPMVMAYRMAPATVWLVRRLRLMKIRQFALPNLLAREQLVAEYIQNAASGENLCDAIAGLLEDDARREAIRRRFADIHRALRHDAAECAADAIVRAVAG